VERHLRLWQSRNGRRSLRARRDPSKIASPLSGAVARMTVTTAPLDYYRQIGAALFPIPAGSKNPTGIVESFKKDHSTDPAQWAAWREANPGCNFGVVAFASRLIIVDIDTKIGRDEAWAAWHALCHEWGIATLTPHTQSARGGWHVYFAVPDDVDPAKLRQPDALKKVINTRCIGYTVAAGSVYNDPESGQALPYSLLTDAPPYPAPAALIEHCTRRPAASKSTQTPPGSLDPAGTAALITWLTDKGEFSAYEDWVSIGMALKLEFGDAGFPLWELTFDETVTPDTAATKWDSFATEPDSHSVTLLTFMQRAHKAGWKGSIGRTAASMFGDVVANLAKSAGATTPGALAGQTQRIIANQGEPYLSRFFDTIHDVPIIPRNPNHPTLPGNLEELYPSIFEAMKSAIGRIVVMAETPRTFKQQRVLRVLGVLQHMHAPTCQAVVDYIHGLGSALSSDRVTAAAKDFEKEINASLNEGRTSFYCDAKNRPDPAISDNVGVFLNLSNHRTQWDTFGRKVEVAHGDDPFVHFDQDEFERLWMMAKSVDYNYHPAENVLRTGIKVQARKTQYDSLEDEVQRLGDLWDGKPRLDTWLSQACNVAQDAYHTAVGRNLIGGMVKRAREPGCKHDEVVIFISPEQGTGKSTLANILARKDDWFLGKFKFGQSDQSSLPLLAGKWIVELGELAGLSKTDFEDVKSFLSERIDTYVAKYEVLPTKNPRRCIFIGTSNLRQPLADPSGNRRFLPVHVVGSSNLDWLRANIDQIIGEAARRHAQGESFAIPEELWALTRAAQESARAMTAVEEAIYDWFDRPEGAFYIVAGDIGRALKMAGLPAQSRYGVFMEKLGWHFAQVGRDRTRVWIKHTSNNIGECLSLEPSQSTANGRVEMRVRMAAAPSTGLPPPPVPLR
jgi:hypothetical protein